MFGRVVVKAVFLWLTIVTGADDQIIGYIYTILCTRRTVFGPLANKMENIWQLLHCHRYVSC